MTRTDAAPDTTSRDPRWQSSVDGRVTPRWITECLHAAGVISHAQVVAFEQHPCSDLGLTGDLRRLQLCYDKNEPGAPASLVVKASAENPEVKATVHSMGFYEREIRFYQQLAAHCPVRVPTCYAGWVDASGNSVLLLEDLSSLINLNWQAACTVADAKLVVRQMAALHAAWWDNPQLKQANWLELTGPVAHHQAAGNFTKSWHSFLDKLSVPATAEIQQVERIGQQYLSSVLGHLHTAAPTTLVHNDVQGNNIFITADHKSATFIDWQLSTHGRGPLDLAMFLGGNLEPKDRRKHEDSLLRDYHTALTGHGVHHYSLEQCLLDYRLALLPAATRLATAVGTHPELHRNPDALWNAVFPRYAQALADHDVASLCTRRFTHSRDIMPTAARAW